MKTELLLMRILLLAGMLAVSGVLIAMLAAAPAPKLATTVAAATTASVPARCRI